MFSYRPTITFRVSLHVPCKLPFCCEDLLTKAIAVEAGIDNIAHVPHSVLSSRQQNSSR